MADGIAFRLLCVTLLFWLSVVGAPAYSACIEWQLPEQPLERALLTVAGRAELQLAFDPHLIRGVSAPSIDDCLEPLDLLQHLLVNTEVEIHWVGPRIAVLRLVQSPTVVATATRDYVDEILVTGSHLSPMRADGAAGPVTTMRMDGPSAAGRARLAEVLVSLPAAAGSEFQVHNLQQPFSAGVSGINLRNLGPGGNLVLVNGRRHTVASLATASGATFVDLDTLVPMVAVEQVEILRDGGSAIYGSDALAGVVNVITRRNIEGVHVRARYLSGSQGAPLDRELSLFGGATRHTVQLQWAVSWLERKALSSADRGFTRDTAWSDFGRPGTFLDAKGYYRDPACGVSGSRPSPTGPFCQFDISPYYDLSPRERRRSLFASLHGEQWELEVSWADAMLDLTASPAFPFTLQQPLVPVENPGNPRGLPALFFGRALGAGEPASRSETNNESARIAGQLNHHGKEWFWRGDFSVSGHRSRYEREDAVIERVQAALDGRGGIEGDTWWNPLAGAENPPDIERWFLDDMGLEAYSALLTLDTLARRALPWWQGSELAIGVQYRHEQLRNSFSDLFNSMGFMSLGGGPNFSGRRDVTAVYAELAVPMGALEARLAGRYETYGGASDGFSPKLGVYWQWRPTLGVRASASTSFRAASLYQVIASQSVAAPVRDPLGGEVTLFKTVLSKAESDLDPERALTLSAGIIWQPTVPLRFELNGWVIDGRDLIVKTSPQELVDMAAAGDEWAIQRVKRDPESGQIQLIEAPFINAAKVRTRGVDVLAAFGGERLRMELAATYTDTFRYQEDSEAPWRQGAGLRNAGIPVAGSLPRWRLLSSASWQYRPYLTWGGSVRYTGSYHDAPTRHTIGSHTTLDVDWQWAPEPWKLRVGVLNLLDRDPPRVPDLLGYDRQLHDPRGRLWYVEWQYSW